MTENIQIKEWLMFYLFHAITWNKSKYYHHQTPNLENSDLILNYSEVKMRKKIDVKFDKN